MKILILGAAGHGKDEFAELLKKYHGFKFTSSSLFCLDALFPVLAHVNGYGCKPEAFKDRDDNRMLWKGLIKLINYADKSALAKLILVDNDIYVGMRDNEEYLAAAPLFDITYWIDARFRVPKIDPSLNIAFDSTSMVLIPNNGTKLELENIVKSLKFP